MFKQCQIYIYIYIYIVDLKSKSKVVMKEKQTNHYLITTIKTLQRQVC